MAHVYGNMNVNTERQQGAYGAEAVYSGTDNLNPGDSNVKAYSAAGAVDELLGYKYSKEDARKTNTTMENFEEYMKQQQERAREAGVDEAAREKEEKEAEREIASSLTHEEIKQLAMMGIDVENARLSDIMGMVNTIRGEAKRQESAELMARIAADGNDVDGLIVTGGAVKQAGTGIELDNIEAAEVVMTREQSDYNDVAAEDADFRVTREDIAYLIKNNLEFSGENLYKAHFSGIKLSETKDELYRQMKSQLDKVIRQTGYEVNQETENATRFLLDNELSVTTDNLRKYMLYLDELDKNAGEIDFEGLKAPSNIGEKLFIDVAHIDEKAVYEMSMKGMEITIASAVLYGKNRGEFIPGQEQETEPYAFGQERTAESHAGAQPEEVRVWSEAEVEALSNMRKLQEIRLSMTVEAAARLVGSDINIDTRELSQVVARLRELEQDAIAESLHRNGVSATAENISLIAEMSEKIGSLAQSPASVIAAPLRGYDFTVNRLSDVAKEDVNKQTEASFEQVKRSYEAVGTKVRADMGDSITKAFRNVDDILQDMNLPVNYENQRAVRILGYNQMEITAKSIEEVCNYDRQVNELIEGFYPEAVMGMIKDGINPLDVPIEELNDVIRKRNYNQGVSEAENFAVYLRDMESKGDISPSERESYIGIYRAMTRLARSGDREAGWLYGNGSRLTVRNLITAMRSRKAAGMDINIDDSFGMLESTGEGGRKIDEQIESAFAVSEEDIRAINDEAAIAFAKQENVALTMVNARAIQTMLNRNGGIYELASEILMKMKFEAHTKEAAIDEETENMTDSMTETEPDIEIIPENILDSLLGSEEMALKYEDLRNQLIEAMYGAAAQGTITSVDISAIKTVAAGYNILSGMARNERYQIPVRNGEGISVMNLTIRHEAQEKGNIEISFVSERAGRVTADIRLTKENTLTGSVTSDSSEGNEMLIDMGQSMVEGFAKAGYVAGSVSFGQLSPVIATDAGMDGRRIYQAAVAAVKILGRI